MPIKTPTVLILGAAASMHCNYPLGVKLLSELSNLRNTNNIDLLPSNWDKSDAIRFLTKLSRSAHYSIDAYLETSNDDMALGKYLLALSLKRFEILDNLFPPNNSGWYQYLFNCLISKKTGFDDNNLTIVTFNYDRSLEAYLFNVLINRFSLSNEEALIELNKIPIIHVHGILGDFPAYPYEPDSNPNELLEISNSIQIIHEIEDDDQNFSNRYFEQAHNAIKNAEKVCFFGFGFHTDIVRRFKINWGDNKERRLQLTMPNTTRDEYTETIKRLEPFGFSKKIMPQPSGHSCDEFFRHHSLLE